MPTSAIVNELISCGKTSYVAEPDPVQTKCKASFLGRIVYRVTYPVRQLVSNIVMIPFSWVQSAVEWTQKALGDRSCLIKVPLAVLAGTGAFMGGLVVGIAVGSTFELGASAVDAICQDDMDGLDTLLERRINQALHKPDEKTRDPLAYVLRTMQTS